MTKDQSKANERCRQARRQIILDIVRANPGCSLRDVVSALEALHAEGGWPKAPWQGARQDPYSTGIRQTMFSMRYGTWRQEGTLITLDGEAGWGDWRWYVRGEVADLAEKLLPQGAEADELAELLARFRRDSGRDILIGVRDDLVQVVRIDTGRGVLEEEVHPKYGWLGALLAVGVIDSEYESDRLAR